MKTLILLSLILIAPHNSALSTNSSTSDFRDNLERVYILREKLKLNEFVEELESRIEKIYQEVITKTVRKKESASAINLLGFISGYKMNSVTNITKFILENPEEVAKFESQQLSQFRELQTIVKDYISQNKASIVEMKLLILNSIIEATKVIRNDDYFSPNDLALIEEVTKDLVFVGKQSVTICERFEHAEYINSNQLRGSYSFLGIPLAGFSDSKVVTHKKYSETHCEFLDNLVKIKPEETILVFDLVKMDSLINQKMQVLYFTWILADTEPNPPGFDSPYFR
jgi:hypothetical protein